jgi:hypothetical protein
LLLGLPRLPYPRLARRRVEGKDASIVGIGDEDLIPQAGQAAGFVEAGFQVAVGRAGLAVAKEGRQAASGQVQALKLVVVGVGVRS